MADEPAKSPAHPLLLGVNVNFQYASIPKRHRARMVACLEGLVQAVEDQAFDLTLFMTGVSAEWLADRRPDLVRALRSLYRRGLIEIGSHTYSHAVLTLIPERDQLWQVQWGEDSIRDVFGIRPRGLFVPEFGFGRRTSRYIAQRGDTDYVIGPLGRRSLEAFQTLDGVLVIRPTDRGSKRLKEALMGRGPVPRLRSQEAYCLVADAEYPFFAWNDFGLGLDRWKLLLASLSAAAHQPERIGSWLNGMELESRPYSPRVPTKHRTWFQGIDDYDARMEELRRRIGDSADPPREAIRDLLLAENSDGYECMTQGYVGNGWDQDARRALARGLRLTGTTTSQASSES